MGRGGAWRFPATERTLTAEIQGKHLLFLYFDLFSSCFWIFFFSHSVAVVVDFISTVKSTSAFENFLPRRENFFFYHTSYFLFILLSLCWPSVVLWGFPFKFLKF